MIRTKHLICSLFLILAISVITTAKEWRGIIPLKSTRIEVEKLLGVPMSHSKGKYVVAYKTKNERVSVSYSTAACNKKPSNGWNVPENTVITITVEPDVKPKFADFKLNKSKYTESKDDLVIFTSYTNEEEGFSITVNTEDGIIDYFIYFPESKYNYLLCSSSEKLTKTSKTIEE
jgi:hypothetical protein